VVSASNGCNSLGAEHDNLRVALAWACEHDPESAYQLAGLLRWFWYYSDYQLEASASYTRLHSLPKAGISARSQALALLGEIMFTYYSSRQELEQVLTQSQALWLEVGDNERLSEALLWIGDEILYRYPKEEICSYFAQHETLIRQFADPFVLAYALTAWGWALSLGKDAYERARSLHAEALAIGYRWQDPAILGTVYQNLGHLSLTQRGLCNRQTLFARGCQQFFVERGYVGTSQRLSIILLMF
jgi:hypothetical protein